MHQKIISIIFLVLSVFNNPINSQTINETLSLDDVLRIAREQSPQAILAKHTFRNSYWEYRTHIAEYRPSLTLTGNVLDYDRSIDREYDNGEEIFVELNNNNSLMELELNQNIGLTGGELFVSSSLRRYDVLGTNSSTSFITTPTSIGYSQSTIKYNELKWEKKINPLKYEEAKKQYIENVELVNIRAVGYFFDLVLAQKNLEIAEFNYSNTDTLYKIATGRFNIGTIAENELLQMELSYLNSGLALNEAKIDLELRRYRLRSFLGYNDKVNITLIIPDSIPNFEVEVNKALSEAKNNHPDILGMERQLLEAAQDVAESRAEKGLDANIYASYGLTQRANELTAAYKNPLDQQGLLIGIELPLIDWGLGRGQYKMAQSAQEVVRTNVLQERIDFEQEIFLMAMQFNLQDDQVEIARKAGDIAQSRYAVAKSRFLIGKIDVLDLNVAQSEKDDAQQKYISALRNYWDYFYGIRRLTLFDFEKNEALEQDFDEVMN